ncbi:hypothetical protein C1752_00360 [Acaryochloris thomasi RCC1774]|uniref:Uncharacterized protein n=1 Tax=Acaryochloris thomasi RCC1774 TaxID=1764569 RepID=A0A2W1K054_9CYAN|nr:hypothetical protein [Acaryochloris thomasi]PZD75502.1 hypothetical protein C1752_00360 [Acaryochloris thomasi RCC1774]
MSLLRKSLTTVAALYLLYVLKWAIGIDLFSNFHAPRFVKLPAEIAVVGIQKLGIEVALPGQPLLDQPYEDMATLSEKPVS